MRINWGWSRRESRTASWPSPALLTSSKSGHRLISAARPSRKRVWSSAMRTVAGAPRGSGMSGDLHGDPTALPDRRLGEDERAAPGARADRQAAADLLHPLAHDQHAEARVRDALQIEADAVVLDLEAREGLCVAVPTRRAAPRRRPPPDRCRRTTRGSATAARTARCAPTPGPPTRP